jgi:hypothetical protein
MVDFVKQFSGIQKVFSGHQIADIHVISTLEPLNPSSE